VSTFVVVANRPTATSARLGPVLSPARAIARLRVGDVALARLDVLPSLDGIEPGLWALDRLEALGVTVLNPRRALVAAHDKLATSSAVAAAGVPHPRTAHVAPWLPFPEIDPPVVLKPRFGSWGRDVVRCDTTAELAQALEELQHRSWFDATGGIVQRLVTPRGFDLRIIVAGGRVAGAIRRVAARGEWRTNVALGGRRESVLPPARACAIALAAAEAVGGDLVGVDLLPADADTWTVLEINGAVDFTAAYTLGDEILSAVRDALLARSATDTAATAWPSRPDHAGSLTQ
jgi:RimK family alpha-L-glutamate ligase